MDHARLVSAIVKKIKRKKDRRSQASIEVKAANTAKRDAEAAGAARSSNSAATPTDGSTFLEENEIVIHPEDAPLPCTNLAAAPFPHEILELLTRFTEPTARGGKAQAAR